MLKRPVLLESAFSLLIDSWLDVNALISAFNSREISLTPLISTARSRCSPYEVSEPEHKSDLVSTSTPIELTTDLGTELGDTADIADIAPIDDPEPELPDMMLEDQELDNNYDEDNISFVNHSLSQQPLLNMSTFAHSHV